MTRPDLQIAPPEPPQDRGPLMTGQEIAHKILRDRVSPAWVRRNVPGKITLGRSTVMWYERDVYEYIESRKDSVPRHSSKGVEL